MSEKNNTNNNQNNDEKDENKSLMERTSVYEWLVAALGLLLIMFSFGYVLYYSVTSEGKPPDLVVSIESVKPVASGYLVEFKVKNRGDKTASNVVIEGKTEKPDGEAETRTTQFDYVASRSEKKGGLVYSEKPDEQNLKLAAIGYESP